MKPRIKLAFCDFWAKFNPANNYFTRLLSKHFDVQLSDDPDFLIFSCFGRQHRNFRCTRIYYTGENTRPDFRHCDYALTFDHSDNPRHFRLPLYGMCGDPLDLIKPPDFDLARVLEEKTRFCNFVYSNPLCPTRNRFFHELSKYKQVDAGGRLFNNIGGPIADKFALLRQSKFTIAFENESQSGYTTEKLSEPMHANSLPIYWGNPEVGRDFNPRSFINAHVWPNLQAVIDHIIEVDRNDALYCDYLRQPWYHENRVNHFVDPSHVLRWFLEVIENPSPAPERITHPAQLLRFDSAAKAWYSMRRRLRKTSYKLDYRLRRY
jgi:hypothetical protein